MQTRREALVAVGLAKPGRGKFSKDALAWLADQRTKGVKFSDDEGPAPKVEKKEEKPTAPVQVDPRDSAYLSPSDFRFPEAEYRAVAWKDGKKVTYSLRECCNTCRVSLVNHFCDAPTILGDIVVKIVKV